MARRYKKIASKENILEDKRVNVLRSMKIMICIGLLGLLSVAQSAHAQSGRYLIHTATAANISGNMTYIDSPYTNGQPNQMLMVTQDWSGVGVYNNRNIGVWYSSLRAKWAIFNQNLAAMPVNATFFVYVSAPYSGAFTHIAGAGNISGNWTTINNAATNLHPEMKLFVTPKYNPNNIYENHPIGVWYNPLSGKWTIFNQDLAAMPSGAAFNVFVLPAVAWGAPWPDGWELVSIWTHIANANNSASNYTVLNTGASGQANVWVFATPVYNPNNIYNNHPIGLWYTGQVWSIFNQDFAPIPNNAAFNVWMRSFRPRPITPP